MADGEAAGDVELARSRLWQLVGLCLRAAPDAATLRLIAGLQGDQSPLGVVGRAGGPGGAAVGSARA
ncbi:MAG: hypothetical protein R3D25_01925 [Geminicoccaceae bacterium]